MDLPTKGFITFCISLAALLFAGVLLLDTEPPSCAELQAEVAVYQEFMRDHSCGSMQVEDFLRYHKLRRQAERCAD